MSLALNSAVRRNGPASLGILFGFGDRLDERIRRKSRAPD